MFQVSSTISGIRTLADGGWRLQIDTQELTPEEASELTKLKQKHGWFLFKENPVEAVEIPTEPAKEFDNDKTPSQQLRSVLYVYWRDCTSQKPDFETFYRTWIAKKVAEVKELLPRV